jgi:predicted DCC family thiol-disulfide oxidoreductase YuxK
MANRAPLILYDGVCGLCDRTIQTLLRIDHRGILMFAPLQGETAAAVRNRHPEMAGVDSIVFVSGWGADEEIYIKSEGFLRILREVGGVWALLAIFRVVPRTIRDALYDFVARNRYGWFGKFDACKIPAPSERARFLP